MQARPKCALKEIFPKLLSHFNSNNSEVQDVLLKFYNAINFNEQQKYLNMLAKYLEEDEHKEFIIKLLTYLFMKSLPAQPLRKTLFRVLSGFKETELLTQMFSENIHLIIEHSNDYENLDRAMILKFNFITSLMSNADFSPFNRAFTSNLQTLLNFALTEFENLYNILTGKDKVALSNLEHKIGTLMQYILKFLLMIIQSCELNFIQEENRLNLIKQCFDVMINKSVNYNTKSTCGHIILILFKVLPQDILKECSFKEYPYLEFVTFSKHSSEVVQKLGLPDIIEQEILEQFKVCMFVNILIVAPKDCLVTNEINGEPILAYIFKKIVEFTNRPTIEITELTIISKAINTASSYLEELTFEIIYPMFVMTLDYIKRYLDEKVDLIKRNCETTFENIIQLSLKHKKDGKNELLNICLELITNIPMCNTRLMVLRILSSRLGCTFILDSVPNLPKMLINEITHITWAAQICACYENLMEMHTTQCSQDDWLKYWVDEIIGKLKGAKPPESQFFQNLFIAAFKIEPITLTVLTQQPVVETDCELIAFLGCIHHARRTGLVLNDLPLLAITEEYCWRGFMDRRTLQMLYTHQNDEIKLLTLGIVVDSHRSTELFDEWELNFIYNFLFYNINTPNASTRQQMVTYMKRTFTRLNNSFSVKLKSYVWEDVIRKGSNKIENNYAVFLTKILHQVLLPGLSLDSNYARRSACLKLLQLLAENLRGVDAFFKKTWNTDDLNNLKCILQYDTYEQNKEAALQLLKVFPPESLGFHTNNLVISHLKECMQLAASIKPAQTISAAYMLQACLNSPHIHMAILEWLKIKEVSVQRNINNGETIQFLLEYFISALSECHKTVSQGFHAAAEKSPIHGIVFCIRKLLKTVDFSQHANDENWKYYVSKIMFWCYKFRDVIVVIICNKSPEGFMPDDDVSDNLKVDKTPKAQMVTVYGWRAARETSLLLGEIAVSVPFLKIDDLLHMGNYFLRLLIYTKHRGAFEQISVAFLNLCSKLWTFPDNKAKSWMVGCILEFLETKNEHICATRRSAGIPFMIQSILATEPKINNRYTVFDQCMNTLIKIASDASEKIELRIHCTNILKALYRHNQLGERVAGYCAKGVIIALQGCRSDSWNLRNASTLLFAVLMVRMFGVQRTRDSEDMHKKNRMFVQVFFSRYPQLYEFLLEELKLIATQPHSPSLYPTLLILNRLHHSGESTVARKMNLYLKYLLAGLFNSDHKIRELTAKTFVHLISPSDIPRHIAKVLKELSDVTLPDIYCHGLLLQLQCLLSCNESTVDTSEFLNTTAWILICGGAERSHMTATVYLEVLIFLIQKTNLDQPLYNRIFAIVKWKLGEECKLLKVIPTTSEKYYLYLFHLLICMLLNILDCTQNFDEVIMCQKIIFSSLLAYNKLQHICLSYMNFLKFTGQDFADHELEDEDYLEFPELIEQFLKALNYEKKKFLYTILYDVLSTIYFQDDKIELSLLSDKSLAETFMLHYYPLRIQQVTYLVDHILKFLIECCEASDDRTIPFTLACLDNFLKELDDNILMSVTFDRMISVLLQFCTKTYDTPYRLGVAKLLIHNKHLFHRKDSTLTWSNMCMIWIIVFILLEDDEEVVRNKICLLCMEKFSINESSSLFYKKVDIPEFSKEQLMDNMIDIMPMHCSIDVLLFLTLRQREVTGSNISEVFDEGEDNVNVELFPIARLAVSRLYKILWTLEDGLNFEDKSIFVGEQVQVITTILYDKFSKNVVPLLSTTMSTSVRFVLMKIMLFLEKILPNSPMFNQDFKKSLDDSLNAATMKSLHPSDFLRLKMLISKLYEPVLWKTAAIQP